MNDSEGEVNLLEFSIHPSGGWLRHKRDKFGITGPQLAAKMGVTKQRISALEKAELSGAASLKTMRQAAAALGCEFVYALIPRRNPEAPLTATVPEQRDPLECMQSQECRQQIAQICNTYDINHLGLYGSAARGELSASSDINLLAEFSSTLHQSASDIEEVEVQFGRLFGRKTTIVNQDILDDPNRVDAILADLKLIYLS